MSIPIKFKLHVIHGHIEIDSRITPCGCGQSRKRIYDGNGQLIETTHWQGTGIRLIKGKLDNHSKGYKMTNKNIGCIGLGFLLGYILASTGVSVSGVLMCLGAFLAYYCLFTEIEKLAFNGKL